MFFQGQPVTQSSSQPVSPECPWCHLRIMRKECSQLFSVLIISDVEEMVGLWVDASPAESWGWGGGVAGGGQEGVLQGEKG